MIDQTLVIKAVPVAPGTEYFRLIIIRMRLFQAKKTHLLFFTFTLMTIFLIIRFIAFFAIVSLREERVHFGNKIEVVSILIQIYCYIFFLFTLINYSIKIFHANYFYLNIQHFFYIPNII